MHALTMCSTVLCAALLTATPAAIETRDILPAAKTGFTLEVKGDASPSLLDLLSEYQRATGLHLVLSAGVQAEASKSGTGLTQSLVVPQDKVHTLVETLLANAGFCTVLLHQEEPILLAVKKTDQTPLGVNAVFVDVAQLAAVEKHPALLCWTVLELESMNVGELTNSVRPQWDSPDFQLLPGFGGPHRLLLIGKGKDVSSRARSLQELDASQRRKSADAAKSSGGSIK